MAPQGGENSAHDPIVLLADAAELVESLYGQSRARDWGLSRTQFSAGLARSVQKRFEQDPCTPERFEEYLQTLHVEDLALACGCMQGSEAAWEYFVGQYRGYLRASAGVLTKGSRGGADSLALADSLYAELYGLADGARGERSLFRYFHGRASLKTWLRAILAQRYVDQIRGGRKWESLETEDGELRGPESEVHPNLDPHRERYVALFVKALTESLGSLDPADRQRLELYYARGMKLAAIGRVLAEHESTASRNLDRARAELRLAIENRLKHTCGLSEAEVRLSIQYAAEDSPLDFRKLFPEKDAGGASARRKEPL